MIKSWRSQRNTAHILIQVCYYMNNNNEICSVSGFLNFCYIVKLYNKQNNKSSIGRFSLCLYEPKNTHFNVLMVNNFPTTFQTILNGINIDAVTTDLKINTIHRLDHLSTRCIRSITSVTCGELNLRSS